MTRPEFWQRWTAIIDRVMKRRREARTRALPDYPPLMPIRRKQP